MSTASTGYSKDAPMFQPLAAVAAWVIPGGGHLLLGHVRRGVLILVGTLGLFAGGLFIGGISCVDRKESFFWFLGQSLTGPVTLGVDYVHQTKFKAFDPAALNNARSTADLPRIRRRGAFPNETRVLAEITLNDGISGRPTKTQVATFRPADPSKGEGPPYIKSLGRANELGTLFCTIAGFLNLICIIDAAWRRPANDPRSQSASPALGGAKP